MQHCLLSKKRKKKAFLDECIEIDIDEIRLWLEDRSYWKCNRRNPSYENGLPGLSVPSCMHTSIYKLGPVSGVLPRLFQGFWRGCMARNAERFVSCSGFGKRKANARDSGMYLRNSYF